LFTNTVKLGFSPKFLQTPTPRPTLVLHGILRNPYQFLGFLCEGIFFLSGGVGFFVLPTFTLFFFFVEVQRFFASSLFIPLVFFCGTLGPPLVGTKNTSHWELPPGGFLIFSF